MTRVLFNTKIFKGIALEALKGKECQEFIDKNVEEWTSASLYLLVDNEVVADTINTAELSEKRAELIRSGNNEIHFLLKAFNKNVLVTLYAEYVDGVKSWHDKKPYKSKDKNGFFCLAKIGFDETGYKPLQEESCGQLVDLEFGPYFFSKNEVFVEAKQKDLVEIKSSLAKKLFSKDA